MKILEEIIASKNKEIAENRLLRSVKELEKSPYFDRAIIPLTDYILNPEKSGIIAEFKRKSPSKGVINSKSDVCVVTSGYSLYGASGLSVLTDSQFFGGSNEDLSLARQANNIPVLRKDFIIDEYQIIESRSIGTDAILLIAAALDKKKIMSLARFARSLDLQVLLEIHNKTEIDTINEFINVVGVNNRNLNTFEVNTGISLELLSHIPEQFVKISESGLSSVDVVRELRSAGYDGFLMGEIFMKSSDPVAAFSDFVSKI
jgi:indole-3-glycerol phosphate synthase